MSWRVCQSSVSSISRGRSDCEVCDADGDENRKGRPLAELAREANLPTHQSAETAADRQAQAAAAIFLRRRIVDLDKLLEQLLLLLGRHADSSVADLENDERWTMNDLVI